MKSEGNVLSQEVVDEEAAKAFVRAGVSSRTIDKTKNINRHSCYEYYWTEVDGVFALPTITRKDIHNYIEARKEYEYLSGREFKTDENHEIDLGKLMTTIIQVLAEKWEKQNAILKEAQTK